MLGRALGGCSPGPPAEAAEWRCPLRKPQGSAWGPPPGPWREDGEPSPRVVGQAPCHLRPNHVQMSVLPENIQITTFLYFLPQLNSKIKAVDFENELFF